MALQGCYACIKYLVIIFNFLFWLAGIGVLALAIYAYVKGQNYSAGTDEIKTLFTSLYILMAAGSLMTVLGFLGCCGALRESQCMLGSFFFLVLLILIAEIVAGVWAVLHQKEVKSIITKEYTRMMQEEYGKNAIVNKTVDAIQHDFECCGVNSPSDWTKSDYQKVLKIHHVPLSCCKDPNACAQISLIDNVIGSFVKDKGIYEEGCLKKIEEFVKNNLTIVAGVGIGLGVIQILGLIFSIVLCCAIRNGEGVSYHV